MGSEFERGRGRQGHARLSAAVFEGIDTETAPQDFFRGVVTDALEDRGIATSCASESYLVALLSDHAGKQAGLGELSEPFGLRLAHAMDATGGERFEKLRTLGDDVLFLSGFFSEHLERRGVPLDYIAGLGQVAYGGVASMLRGHSDAGPPVFDELSHRFTAFVSVFQHIADTMSAYSARGDSDVLELYERWSRTGSSVLADALLKLGVLPTKGRAGMN